MSKSDILVVGVHKKTDGYPNIKFKIEKLLASNLSVTELNRPVPVLGFGMTKSVFTLCVASFYFMVNHVLLLVSYCRNNPANKVVYIPYPAVMFCFLLSLLPRRLKPKKIVLDAFISLYDTIVCDRKLLRKTNVIAKYLLIMEARAYAFADKVITDTHNNSDYFSLLFELPLSKFEAVPLTIDEHVFHYHSKAPGSTLNVLFVGTMVPLHGIDSIMACIKMLRLDKSIQFRVVGSGQSSRVVDDLHKLYPDSFEWISDWQSSDKVMAHIQWADVCLGIFGVEEKTQRVCPLKMYLYMACGKAVVTGATAWTEQCVDDIAVRPFECIPVGDSCALAEKLQSLYANRSRLSALSVLSLRFYRRNMSNKVSMARLIDVMMKS